MACHENNTALHLILKEPYSESKIPQSSIKLPINSDNYMPSPQKYNVSTLRLPADPSWPKIPQRRFADNVGDIIDQPCVVTVTGTPRRSRTIVKTPHSQTIKGITSKEAIDSSYHCSGTVPVTQPLKRRPGCVDPRFKRVTTVKSQMTSTEPQEQEHETATEMSHSAHVIPNQTTSITERIDQSIPEKDTNVQQVIQQEAEKPNELKSSEVKIHTIVVEKEQKTSKPPSNPNALEDSANQKNESKAETALECSQAYHEEIIGSEIGCCQCCNLQFTILETSKNRQSNNSRKDSSLRKYKCSAVKHENNSPPQGNEIITTCNCSEHKESDKFIREHEFDRETKFSERKIESQCFCEDKTHFQCKFTGRCKTFVKQTGENVDDQVQTDDCSISLSGDEIFRNHCKLHQIIDDKDDSCIPATTDSEYIEKEKSITSRKKTRQSVSYLNSAGEESNYSAKDYQQIDFFQTHDVCLYNCVHDQPKNSNKRESNGKEIENLKSKQKMKSYHDLSPHMFGGRKLFQNSEPHINLKQRRCSTSYSKKTSQHCQEKPINTNSEFNFILPERQRAKRKSSHCYSQKLTETRRNRSCDADRINNPEGNHNSEKIENLEKIQTAENHSHSRKNNHVGVSHSTDLEESRRTPCKKLCEPLAEDLNPSVVDIINNHNILKIDSPRADTDIVTDKPTTIPVETQQLLNKSYWEYYMKLKQETTDEKEDYRKEYFCQVALGAPQIKKKRGNLKNYGDRPELSSPEIRTLERCSVLSSIINKTLDPSLEPSTDNLHTKQLYMNGNMKSFSDPTAGTASAVVNQVQSLNPPNADEGSSISSKIEDKRKQGVQVNNRLVRPNAIVIFGILLYMITILLPMIYDYFFYEEYDEYEDLTYIEFTLQYIVSSFREAYAGLFELLNKIFFRPFFVIFSAPVENVAALLKNLLSIIVPFRS